jgi:hypothetical protein
MPFLHPCAYLAGYRMTFTQCFTYDRQCVVLLKFVISRGTGLLDQYIAVNISFLCVICTECGGFF